MPSSSCFQYCCTEDELDVDGLCYDSNSIVEITLQRDYLLLKLQELVDSKTSQQAERAIRAMDEGCVADDDNLLRFLVRAGTIPILHDVLARDGKEARPSPVVAASLLRKLSNHEASLKKARPSWSWRWEASEET